MISVIIPAYNASRLIERTISSIQNQSYDGEIEIVIVDDCSTDDTASVVEAIGDKRIRYYLQESNQGPSAARNRGIRECKGEYIAFIDSDDYWKEDFLKETYCFLENHPEAVAVFTGQEHKTLSNASSIEPKCLIRENPPAESLVLDDFFVFWKEQGATPLCSGSILMRGDLLRRIGGQRENLRICEDLEYWCYVGLHGKIGFIPKILFVSDGVRGNDSQKRITRRQRLARYRPRWHNAVPIRQWIERLNVTALPGLSTDGFHYVIGDVAAIMVYSMIQDGRWTVAFKEFRSYHQWMPNTSMKRLMAKCSCCILTWYLLCLMLYSRERLKK